MLKGNNIFVILINRRRKMTTKIFESFLEKVSEFPFWVKEIIYIKLREEFEQAYLSEADLHAPIEEAYQAYKPMLTYAGKKELADRSNSENEAVYRFLQIVQEDCSIAEITLRNFWTLENTAKANIYCIQKEYVQKPTSVKVLATAQFIAGRIKIGEYCRRIGKITVDQLDTAIRRQKELEGQGKQVHFAEVLIQLGYITEQETKAVIYIKDECKKRFIFNANMLGKSTTTTSAEKIELNSEFENSKGGEKSAAQMILLRQEIFDLQSKLKEIERIIKR